MPAVPLTRGRSVKVRRERVARLAEALHLRVIRSDGEGLVIERKGMGAEDGELIEVAECPYGCGEMHEVQRECEIPIFVCHMAPREGVALFACALKTRLVRLRAVRPR